MSALIIEQGEDVAQNTEGSQSKPFDEFIRNQMYEQAQQSIMEKVPESRNSNSADTKFRSAQSLSAELLDNGLMPALDKKDIPSTLARAAEIMNGKNIGLPTDGNLSSGSSVSRLLQAVGADVRVAPNIPNLKNQLDKLGWDSFNLQDKESLKPGDILFTSMDPQGRNVGIVGDDGKIFSHNFTKKVFEGRDNWSSRFITVMRQKDQ